MVQTVLLTSVIPCCSWTRWSMSLFSQVVGIPDAQTVLLTMEINRRGGRCPCCETCSFRTSASAAHTWNLDIISWSGFWLSLVQCVCRPRSTPRLDFSGDDFQKHDGWTRSGAARRQGPPAPRFPPPRATHGADGVGGGPPPQCTAHGTCGGGAKRGGRARDVPRPTGTDAPASRDAACTSV